MTFTRRLRKILWEFFHALDGFQVRWKPFAIQHEAPRWEDR